VLSFSPKCKHRNLRVEIKAGVLPLLHLVRVHPVLRCGSIGQESDTNKPCTRTCNDNWAIRATKEALSIHKVSSVDVKSSELWTPALGLLLFFLLGYPGIPSDHSCLVVTSHVLISISPPGSQFTKLSSPVLNGPEVVTGINNCLFVLPLHILCIRHQRHHSLSWKQPKLGALRTSAQ
jgi:hypothetical protein